MFGSVHSGQRGLITSFILELLSPFKNLHSFEILLIIQRITTFRSSHQCSIKKDVKNFTKFTGKDLCKSLFFSKVAGSGLHYLLKKRLWRRCFPVNFVKF